MLNSVSNLESSTRIYGAWLGSLPHFNAAADPSQRVEKVWLDEITEKVREKVWLDEITD